MANSLPPEQDCIAPEDLEAILDSLVEGIVTLNCEGKITGINRAACEILGVDRPFALQACCRGIFGEHFCDAASSVREAVLGGQPIENVQARLQSSEGTPKVLDFRVTPLRDESAARGSVVIFRDVTELLALREDAARRYRLHNIVGKSKPMQEIFRLVEEVADSDATVLIEGESGTGKELVARAVHHLSPRAAGPFVAVNCSALAEGVLESELFGHVRGAFTGAARDKVGRFQAAAGGTIFLDEIGDLAASIQVKLLRVLQERVIERVGSDESAPVDIRVIAATHRPLVDLIARGEFRQDLYYRLRVVPIRLPALRERRDDLPLLAQHFVDRFREETGRPIEGLSPPALTLLIDYPWPGNVRELENAVEYAFVKCRSGDIRPEHLPPELQTGTPPAPIAGSVAESLPPQPEPAEAAGNGPLSSDSVAEVLRATGWNVAKAARRLNVSRTTLYKRIAELGLERPRE